MRMPSGMQLRASSGAGLVSKRYGSTTPACFKV